MSKARLTGVTSQLVPIKMTYPIPETSTRTLANASLITVVRTVDAILYRPPEVDPVVVQGKEEKPRPWYAPLIFWG